MEVKAPKDAEFGKESRIGKAPIKLPAGVTVKFDSDLLQVRSAQACLSADCDAYQPCFQVCAGLLLP